MESSKMPQDAMGFWRNVPEEITARVMSFLPVPDVCTCRSVCKAWKELLCRPGFLDICDRKGPSYLFITSYFETKDSIWVAGGYQGTMGVFDLEHHRWCSLPLDRILLDHTDAHVPELLAMDDGLICELSYSSINEKHRRLVMFDPVAKTTRALPAIRGAALFLCGDQPPAIVTVVEDSNFKVFVLSERTEVQTTGLFLYESSTDAWRDLGNPMEELGVGGFELSSGGFSFSAVYFHGSLYATYIMYPSRHFLLSYNVEEGLWKIILEVEAFNDGDVEPIVFGNRMFVNMWVVNPDGFIYLEVREILENDIKSVVRIRRRDLDQIFYGEKFELRSCLGIEPHIPYGFAINSDSVVLFSRCTGKLVTYNMTSGCFGIRSLPANPLRQASSELDIDETEMHYSLIFRAKLMNLSLHNILNPPTRLPAISQAT